LIVEYLLVLLHRISIAKQGDIPFLRSKPFKPTATRFNRGINIEDSCGPAVYGNSFFRKTGFRRKSKNLEIKSSQVSKGDDLLETAYAGNAFSPKNNFSVK
jgi:hypothetical protein